LDKPLPPRGAGTPANDRPLTGTLLKTRGAGTALLLEKAHTPLEPPPERPKDLSSSQGALWVEGADWLYAGVGPVAAVGCVCPSVRVHLDWYKRSYVPESYRHSLGILDTNGNLIMHLGRYGNHDDALAMKQGEPNVVLTLPRFISGTDNYLAFDDWGERLVVLKLNYQAEETVGIGEVMSRK
jgi:hypothetical protein